MSLNSCLPTGIAVLCLTLLSLKEMPGLLIMSHAIYLFLNVNTTNHSSVIGCLMVSELERIWKETVVA